MKREPNRKTDNPFMYRGMNRAQVGQLFGIDSRTVERILLEYTPDGDSDKRTSRYMGKTVLNALKNYYGTSKKGRETSLEDERIRLTAAQANKAEMELDISRGALLPVTDVIQEMNKILMAIKAITMNLPARIAPAVFNSKTSREVEQIAKGIVNGALHELEVDLKNLPGRVTGYEAATHADDKPVGTIGEEAKS